MNNKGQSMQMLVIVFIALIVGVILFQTVAQNVGEATNLGSIVNTSLATVVNGTTQYITDYRAISDVIIINETNNVVIAAGNYTITNNVVYNGALAISILPATDIGLKTAWKVSGTVQPLTYIDDAGSRSMASLIVIFFALAVGLIALYPVYESKVLELIGR